MKMESTPKPLPIGFSLGLLFSGIAWMTLTCALGIVLPRSSWWNEQTGWFKQAVCYAPYVLAGIGVLAAYWALHELNQTLPRLTRALAVFFVADTVAVLVGLLLQNGHPHHWPMPELLIGALLAIVYGIGDAVVAGQAPQTEQASDTR